MGPSVTARPKLPSTFRLWRACGSSGSANLTAAVMKSFSLYRCAVLDFDHTRPRQRPPHGSASPESEAAPRLMSSGHRTPVGRSSDEPSNSRARAVFLAELARLLSESLDS